MPEDWGVHRQTRYVPSENNQEQVPNDIKMICPCGQHLAVPAHAVGQSFSCPSCGRQLLVKAESTRESSVQPTPKLDAAYAAMQQWAKGGEDSPNLRACPDCRSKISVNAHSCPHCGRPSGEHQTPAVGCKIRKGEFVGAGAAIQAVGLLACLTIVGAIAGIPLLIIGGRMALKWVCSNCGNRLHDHSVKVCAVCKCHFLE